MPREAAAFGVRLALGASSEIAPGLEVRVCGVGPARAGDAARQALADGAGTVVSFGYCAAVHPRLNAGAIVVASRLAGTTVALQPDPVLGDALRHSLQLAPRFVLAQAPQLLANAASKAALRRDSGADAADMESVAIARAVAASAAGPGRLLVARAVSDSAQQRLPACVASAIDPHSGEVHLSMAQIAAGIVRRPRDLADLLRLALAARAADRSLRSIARALQALAVLWL